MVIADSCDAMKSLYHVLSLEDGNVGESGLYFLSLPRISNEDSVRFYAEQLRSLFKTLVKNSPEKSEKTIHESVRLYDYIRDSIEELRSSVSLSECYLTRLKQRIYNENPIRVLEEVESLREGHPDKQLLHEGNIDIALLGSPVPGSLHLELIERAGFRITLHDSCLNLRWEPQKDSSLSVVESLSNDADPFLRLAERYLKKVSCPRMKGRHTFIDRIIRSYRLGEIGGIIHVRMPFCDLHGFDYARLFKGVGKEGIIQIETDGSHQSEGQIATRIQAFYEVLAKRVVGRREVNSMTKKQKHIFCGIDVGSATIDGALIDEKGNVVAYGIKRTGPGSEKTANNLLREMIADAGITEDDISAITATGYGREGIGFAHKTVTEISCHARGASHIMPGVRFVIDIGGQDSKVIRMDESGTVTNFQMNDKCAAGTGRFLDVMAGALEVDLQRLNQYGIEEGEYAAISSVCTVFAESEVVSLIAQGVPVPNIARGIFFAITRRIGGMVKRIGLIQPVIMTGGGALNKAVLKGMERRLETSIRVPEDPQLIGAIGAAVIARDEGS
jgi:predicted CoA-substrate-specific enzyme activase